MAAARKNVDFTSGSIPMELMAFAMPILLGQLFQNLYNSVDSIVVGRCVGTTALAAVTVCSDISNLLVGFFTGLSGGAGVVFSRYFGARDEERLHRSVHTALLFAALVGLLVALVGIPLSPILLRLTACPADVMPEAVSYLRIYLVGVLFTSFYNVGSGVLRSVGNSRDPFVYLVTGSVCNVVLDIVLVQSLHWGVMGVAVATVISQGLTVLLVIGNLLRSETPCRLVWRDLKMDWALFGEIVHLGLPAAIQTSLISFSNLFVQRYVNLFGSAAMAGVGAAKKIDKFMGIISSSLGLSVSTFVGQNEGARNRERAFAGIRWALLFGFVMMAAVGLPIYYLADGAIRIFTRDAAAVGFGVAMTRCMVPLYYFLTIYNVLINTLRGFGKSVTGMILSLTGIVGVRQLFLAVSMAVNRDVRNVYYAYPVGWISAAALAGVVYYLTVRRKKAA